VQTRPHQEGSREGNGATPRSLLGQTPATNFIVGLLAINAFIVLVAIRSPERLSVERIWSMTLLSTRGLFDGGKIWTIATANLFPAGSPLGLHLLLQLVILLWLGRAVERRLGTIDTVILHIGAALFTSCAFLLLDWKGVHGVLGGGTGLIFAVIACAAVMAPRERMLDGVSLPVPLWVIGVVLVALELAMRSRSHDLPVVTPAELWAPMGGLAWGVAFARLPLGLDRFRDHRRRTDWRRRQLDGDTRKGQSVDSASGR